MQLRFTQVLAGLRQAQRFLDANGTSLGDLNGGGGRKAFDDITARLALLGQQQDAHQMGATGELNNERELARALRREHMHPIVQIARTKVPAAAQLDAVQYPRRRSNNTALAQAGRAMALAVTPFNQLFVEGGMPAAFIDQLNAAAAALEQAIGQKGEHRHKRIGTTDSITQEADVARSQLAVMDRLVRKELKESDPLIVEWRSIVRVVRSALTQASKQVDAAPAAPTDPAAPSGPALVTGAVAPASAAAPQDKAA